MEDLGDSLQQSLSHRPRHLSQEPTMMPGDMASLHLLQQLVLCWSLATDSLDPRSCFPRPHWGSKVCSQIFSPFHSNRALYSSHRQGPASPLSWKPWAVRIFFRAPPGSICQGPSICLAPERMMSPLTWRSWRSSPRPSSRGALSSASPREM